jgi:ribokinase
MKKSIAVIGSANVDRNSYLERFPSEGETLSSLSYKETLGGKGLNQAVAIARAGGKVAFYASVGNDEGGKAVAALLAQEGIENHLNVVSEPTGSASIWIDASGHNEIVLSSGANGVWDVSRLDPSLLSFDAIVFQNEIPSKIDEDLILVLSKRGKTIFYNPAPARLIKEVALKEVDYLLPNEHELALLSGMSEVREGSQFLLQKGVKAVLTTLGEKGSLYLDSKREIHCPATPVKAVDSVAAGDTYIGYLVASLMDGLSLPEAMKKASDAAAICVTRKGAIPSIPYQRELKK